MGEARILRLRRLGLVRASDPQYPCHPTWEANPGHPDRKDEINDEDLRELVKS